MPSSSQNRFHRLVPFPLFSPKRPCEVAFLENWTTLGLPVNDGGDTGGALLHCKDIDRNPHQ